MKPAYLLAIVFLLTSASASFVQDTTNDGVDYQADAGAHGDAPDTCADADAAFTLTDDLDGILMPIDDETDVYQVAVTDATRGVRHDLIGLPADLAPGDVRIDVQVPGCGGSVTAPENQPTAALATPAPGTGQKQVMVSNEASGCSDHWKFIINKVDPARAPASIHMVWTNGQHEDVPLEKVTSAGVATYRTGTDTGYTLHSVTANIYAAWDGKFNVGPGICGSKVGDLRDASGTDHTVSFTPLVTGTYVATVQYIQPEVPTSIPASCHVACRDALLVLSEGTGYGLDMNLA